jgi:hypothetical protein
MRHGWKKKRTLSGSGVLTRLSTSTRNCGCDDFPRFMNGVVKKCPGFLGRQNADWLGESQADRIEFVGRFECLIEDLIAALRHFDEPFDEAALQSTPPQNVGDYKSHPVTWPDGLAERVCQSKSAMIDEFYGR